MFAHRTLFEPSFGAAESPKPAEPHAFRLVAALRATRASASGAKFLELLSATAQVKELKARTGVDPFTDGEWLLAYGPSTGVPGSNANVVKHGRPEADVARSIADGGFDAWDGGPEAGAWVSSPLLGVRDVLLRPQPGLLALVPGDRAQDLATALARPFDPGVRGGELARIHLAEPAKVVHFLPPEVRNAEVVVRPAADGGLDLGAVADCPDPARCKAVASEVDEWVKRQNGLLVRIVLGNVLGTFVIRADGAKLHASLHATPQHVDAALIFLRSELGVRAPDAGAP